MEYSKIKAGKADYMLSQLKGIKESVYMLEKDFLVEAESDSWITYFNSIYDNLSQLNKWILLNEEGM